MRTEEFSECTIADPLIKGGDVIFGEGGNGDIDSGMGVTGNGEISGVKTLRLGEGGIGESGGEMDMDGL
jgi:hypothetical protein